MICTPIVYVYFLNVFWPLVSQFKESYNYFDFFFAIYPFVTKKGLSFNEIFNPSVILN